MYYDRIGYETTVQEDIPLDELFHMMLCFSSAFYFKWILMWLIASQEDPHKTESLIRGTF